MSSFLNPIRRIRKRWIAFWGVNWIKTYYINYKMFPSNVARKLPIFIYGNYKISGLGGTIKIEGPIRRGMIGIGFPLEAQTRSQGMGELLIMGDVLFKGYFTFGKDVYFQVAKDAYCELGNQSMVGSRCIVICKKEIILGEFVRIAYESQLLDTTFHQVLDLKTNEPKPMIKPIKLGNYNWIGNRSTINKGTITPDYCMVASSSVCGKDYRHLEENILIGGVPAQLIRDKITRDWEGEMYLLDRAAKRIF